jgi:hypothetical protein
MGAPRAAINCSRCVCWCIVGFSGHRCLCDLVNTRSTVNRPFIKGPNRCEYDRSKRHTTPLRYGIVANSIPTSAPVKFLDRLRLGTAYDKLVDSWLVTPADSDVPGPCWEQGPSRVEVALHGPRGRSTTSAVTVACRHVTRAGLST